MLPCQNLVAKIEIDIEAQRHIPVPEQSTLIATIDSKAHLMQMPMFKLHTDKLQTAQQRFSRETHH